MASASADEQIYLWNTEASFQQLDGCWWMVKSVPELDKKEYPPEMNTAPEN